MAGEIEHIRGKWFDANPQNINFKWRPKKGISLVNQELEEAWYTPATKTDIEANYLSMLQLGRQKLEELQKDETKPMLVRILAENMLWGKGFDIIERMLDRGIWKAVQRQETELSGTVNTWYDLLLDIQSGKITRENAYEAMRKAKWE